MLRAKIFQKNILKNSIHVHDVLSYNNQLINLEDDSIIIQFDNGSKLKYDLQFHNEDIHEIKTFVGHFEDGTSFRLLRPGFISLNDIRDEDKCVSAFSIASDNPDGYSVHFLLFDADINEQITEKESGKNEQIQRLINGSLMALQANLHQQFIEFTKRLLAIVINASDIKQFDNSQQLLQIMKQNINIYNEEEARKLKSA
jgi:hypothetical protein